MSFTSFSTRVSPNKDGLPSFLITVGLNTAASRLAWGMARDNALPFSNVFVRINHKVQTPVNTILLTSAAQLIIGIAHLTLSA